MAVVGMRFFITMLVPETNEADYLEYTLPRPHQFYDFIVSRLKLKIIACILFGAFEEKSPQSFLNDNPASVYDF